MALPPGVSKQLFNALPSGTLFFDGEGQAGNWSDPANWWKGTAPTTNSVVVVPMNATLNGSFTAHSVMLLGEESVTINGVVNTLDTNTCESFMVCDDAVATFTPGSVLNAAGALIVGNDDVGTMTAEGSGSTRASLTSLDGKIGRLDEGAGTLTITDAVWNCTTMISVGVAGTGTLSVTNGGVVTAGTDVVVGARTGSTGLLALTDGGTLAVGSSLFLGSGPTDPLGSGSALVTVDATSLITVGANVVVNANETLALAGGSLRMGPNAGDVHVMLGGTLSGYGTVSAVAGGVSDFGTIAATGGTLMLTGQVHGSGILTIGSASTLDVNGSVLGHLSVEFTGAAGTLDLATGIQSDAKIFDFASGDHIVMAGVNQIAWNATSDVLTLKESGQVVDKLQFAGSYTGNPFTLSQSSAGAMIGLTPGH